LPLCANYFVRNTIYAFSAGLWLITSVSKIMTMKRNGVDVKSYRTRSETQRAPNGKQLPPLVPADPLHALDLLACYISMVHSLITVSTSSITYYHFAKYGEQTVLSSEGRQPWG
jgi:hypothetical protein